MGHTARTVLALALYSTAIMLSKPKQAKNSYSEPPVSPATARKIDEALAPWFISNQRELAFRKTRDAYAVMVAEFMLQQTTVSTVEGYFPRFMARFPNVHSLAEASEEAVLAQWAGLGYYRRARQLHAAAKAIVTTYSGTIPANVDQLRSLPGIGRYTAGAIASTAYDLPAPILEANTIRVFARLAGLDGVIGETAFTNALWQIATALVSEARSPGDFNIAAMELGSLICRPVPQCPACPVNSHCIAFKSGMAAAIPRPAPKRTSVEVEMLSYAVSTPDQRYLVRQIPSGQWHAGLYEFPTIRITDPTPGVPVLPDDNPAATTPGTINLLGLPVSELREFKQLRYQVTHHRIRLTVYRGSIPAHSAYPIPENCQFLPLANISSLPMGSAQKKILLALIEMDLNSP